MKYLKIVLNFPPFLLFRLAKNSLKTHILRVHENIKIEHPHKFLCDVCGKGFSAQSSLATHAFTHFDRELTQIQCEICGKWAKNQYALKHHKKIHGKQSPQSCPHCEKTEYNGAELRAHIAQFHSMRKHQCQICNKSFARPIRLREHMATHTGQTLYNCLYCTKTFKGNSSRFEHMKRNHPEFKLHHKKKNDDSAGNQKINF